MTPGAFAVSVTSRTFAAFALATALGVSCEAFQQEPAQRPPAGRGRPSKGAAEKPAKRKKGKK